jgi:hypothetical protein
VEGILDLVRRHKPLDVSLVGGEPLVRRKELGQAGQATAAPGRDRRRGDYQIWDLVLPTLGSLIDQLTFVT